MGNFRKYDQPCIYEFQVMGSIDPKWVDWFDDLTILMLGETEILLRGLIADQPALHGVLAVLRINKLTLLSLHRVEDTRIKPAFNYIKEPEVTKHNPY
jgi:hypothetical protein